MLNFNVGIALGLRGIGDHFERLCLTLNCTPNDLLGWQPQNNDPNAADHSLNRLRNQDAPLNKLPLDQVRQIIEAMRESK